MPVSSPYIEWIKQQRRDKKLHTLVEDKLIEILVDLTPDFEPIKEPQGLAGGRNDLLLFRFDGKKILFEIFGSKSQVSRDLRILDKTQADIKIAVLIDKEVDQGIIDKFLKENPEDTYPYIFIGELFDSDALIECKYKLKYLIYKDEESKWQYWTQRKIKVKRNEFLENLNTLNIEIISREDIESSKVSFKKLLSTLILKRLQDMGLARDKAVNILAWLSEENTIPFLMKRLDHGLNVFLYTDGKDHMEFCCDVDLTDYLRIGYEFSNAYLILSMNSLVYEIIEKYITPKIYAIDKKRCIHYTVGSSEWLEEKDGRIVTFGIPKNTKQILIMLPIDELETDTTKERVLHYESISEFVDRLVVFTQEDKPSPTFSEIFKGIDARLN